MYPLLQRKFIRLICCILSVSLSLTSLASASIMSGMVHSDITEQPVHPCHQYSSATKASNNIDNSVMNMHDKDAHSSDMMICDLCSLCTSTILTVFINLYKIETTPVWNFTELDNFTPSLIDSLDKPPSR